MTTFDAPDRLNDDGSVTLRIIPSNWRRYNISPDTYQTVTGDGWEEGELDGLSDEAGVRLAYDDVRWTYDHAGIVRAFAEVLADWIGAELMTLGLASVRGIRVLDSWSPREYNFVSDGFEVELTCDPAELRAITPGFDADAWAHDWYRSCDGFMSFVTSRMDDESWHADYDGEFRVESLLSGADPYDIDAWQDALREAEWEVYSQHVTTEVIGPEYLDTGYTMRELDEWARSLMPTQPETLI